MFWSKLKTAADVAASIVKAGRVLIWTELVAGHAVLRYKNSAGDVATVGLCIISDPIASLPVYDATWGYCRYLDNVFPEISFVGRVHNLTRIRMEIVSIDPGITGNIVLVPIIDGTEGTPLVVAVKAAASEVVLNLPINAGTLSLRRDMSNPADTLQDDGAVTAVVRYIVFEVQYDA